MAIFIGFRLMSVVTVGWLELINGYITASFDPVFVNDLGLCGNFLRVSASSSSGNRNGYDVGGLTNTNYNGAGSTWSSPQVSGTAWARVAASTRQRWSGGVVLAHAAPYQIRNFEVWIGDDANFPGGNTLCYASTSNISTLTNILRIEKFSCDLTGLYVYFVRNNMVNEYFQIDEVAMYKASFYGQIISNGMCVCPVAKAIIGGVCTSCPKGKFSLNEICFDCPDKSTTMFNGSSSIDQCICNDGFSGVLGIYDDDICTSRKCSIRLTQGTIFNRNNLLDGTCNSVYSAQNSVYLEIDLSQRYLISIISLYPGRWKNATTNTSMSGCIADGAQYPSGSDLYYYTENSAKKCGSTTLTGVPSFGFGTITTCGFLTSMLGLTNRVADYWAVSEMKVSGYSAQCFACPANSYCQQGIIKTCPIGSVAIPGATSLSQCICSNPQQSVIDNTCLCPSGTVPSACRNGTNVSDGCTSSQIETCIPCELGTYYPAVGASACQACAVGTFSSLLGSTTCQNCAVGDYALISGGSSIALCQPGNCSAGTFSVNGSSLCIPCPAGTFSVDPVGGCTNCSDGFYSTGSASSCLVCSVCYNGQYAVSNCSASQNTVCGACINLL
jgi:hypothetical protein